MENEELAALRATLLAAQRQPLAVKVRQARLSALLADGDWHESGGVRALLAAAGFNDRLAQRAAKELGGRSPDESPDDLIWVVAVSGNYGISPSFGCCSVPADYHGHNTWGLAIFVDAPGVPHANEFGVSYHGDWPPFFDGLPDLAAG